VLVERRYRHHRPMDWQTSPIARRATPLPLLLGFNTRPTQSAAGERTQRLHRFGKWPRLFRNTSLVWQGRSFDASCAARPRQSGVSAVGRSPTPYMCPAKHCHALPDFQRPAGPSPGF
jgi:hypothetical protein